MPCDEADDARDGEARGEKARPTERRPRPVDEGWAMRAAIHYLDRYAASGEHLRKILARKAERRLIVSRLEAEQEAVVDATIARLKELGLIDDQRFAQEKAGALRRRGTSAVRVVEKLSAKGVPRDTIAATMATDETNDREAAQVLARRRRLGPWRKTPLPDDPAAARKQRDKEIAALCRAGYGVRLAIDVIAGRTADGAYDDE